RAAETVSATIVPSRVSGVGGGIEAGEIAGTAHARVIVRTSNAANNPCLDLMVSILLFEMKKPPVNYTPGGWVGHDGLYGGLSHCEHVCEVGAFQAGDMFILRLTPIGTEGTVTLERTCSVIADAVIKLDGTIDGFDDFEQSELFGIARQRDA